MHGGRRGGGFGFSGRNIRFNGGRFGGYNQNYYTNSLYYYYNNLISFLIYKDIIEAIIIKILIETTKSTTIINICMYIYSSLRNRLYGSCIRSSVFSYLYISI